MKTVILLHFHFIHLHYERKRRMKSKENYVIMIYKGTTDFEEYTSLYIHLFTNKLVE